MFALRRRSDGRGPPNSVRIQNAVESRVGYEHYHIARRNVDWNLDVDLPQSCITRRQSGELHVRIRNEVRIDKYPRPLVGVDHALRRLAILWHSVHHALPGTVE